MRLAIPLLLLATVARADDTMSASVGNGLTIVVDNGKLYVKKGGRSAPLGKGGSIGSVKSDGKAKTVVAEIDDDTCVGSTTYTWSFDHLAARIENAAAFAAMRKNDYKAAAEGFAKAVATDPKWNIAAYNLASTKQLMGDTAGAVAALAPWLASEPIATYVNATFDSDLAPLLDRPELKAVWGKKIGNAKVTADGIVGTVAYAPDRNLIAFTRVEQSGMAISYTIDIQIWDAGSKKLLATSTLVNWNDTQPFSDKPTLTAGGKSAVAGRATKLTTMLDQLGFSSSGEIGAIKREDDKVKASFAKAKLGVVGKDDTARALRGNTVAGTAKIEGKLLSATLVDAAKSIVLTSHRSKAEGCNGGPEVGVYLMKLD